MEAPRLPPGGAYEHRRWSVETVPDWESGERSSAWFVVTTHFEQSTLPFWTSVLLAEKQEDGKVSLHFPYVCH